MGTPNRHPLSGSTERSVRPLPHGGLRVGVHAGLEDANDLASDFCVDLDVPPALPE